MRGYRCDVCRQMRRKERSLCLRSVQHLLRNGDLHSKQLPAQRDVQQRHLQCPEPANLYECLRGKRRRLRGLRARVLPVLGCSASEVRFKRYLAELRWSFLHRIL